MAYLIDSNLIIYHLNGRTAATDRLRRLFREQPAISVIRYLEVLDGLPDDDDEAVQAFGQLVQRIPVIVFSEVEARRTAQLRRGGGHWI